MLRCQACRSELPAAATDLAFRCGGCGRAWEITRAGLAERPSYYLPAPAGTTLPRLYLPYWSFRVAAAARPKSELGERQLAARDRAARLERAFVSAFHIHRPTYVGEWGLNYTRIQPPWEARSGRGPSVCGAAIGSSEAEVIARHYVLAEIDRAADLGSLSFEVELGPAELWVIPCHDQGTLLRCPWTRAELPAAAVDDLAEIRRGTNQLEA